jgi:hypothetical protein
MSGAAAAREAVRKALKQTYTQVYNAGRNYANAYQQAVTRDDLVDAMGSMVEAILAAEQLQKAAVDAVKTARATLAAQMLETGATQIASGHHLAHLSRRPAALVIDDPKELPAEYLMQPPPIPDRKRIHDAIDAGQSVAGASIVRPNDMVLSIRNRSST